MRVDFQGLERVCFGGRIDESTVHQHPLCGCGGRRGPWSDVQVSGLGNWGRRHQASSWGTQEEERCGVRGKAWCGSHWV